MRTDPPVPDGNHHQPGFWHALAERERAALHAVARPRSYPARTALCHEGERYDHVIVVIDGWAKVTGTTADGHEVVLAVRGPGDLVGESAVLARRVRSATVTALDRVHALLVPADRFTAFLDAHPRTWRLLSGTFVHRLDDADRRVRDQASASGAQRLADLLLHLADLSERYVPPAPDGSIVIRPPLSQEELGSWVGASRETVARALHGWRRQGLVRTGWRRITVVDRKGLRAYAHEHGPEA
jgi:CRP/FNR family transcriptional regulator, cyclic AMP receptor protein